MRVVIVMSGRFCKEQNHNDRTQNAKAMDRRPRIWQRSDETGRGKVKNDKEGGRRIEVAEALITEQARGGRVMPRRLRRLNAEDKPGLFSPKLAVRKRPEGEGLGEWDGRQMMIRQEHSPS
jgi:hypothetical protein